MEKRCACRASDELGRDAWGSGDHRAGSLTNNEAEYQTLLGALRHLLDLLGERAATASLEVRGDSALVLQQVLGAWKAKDDRMRALRDETRALLRRFLRHRLAQQPREQTVKVLGH